MSKNTERWNLVPGPWNDEPALRETPMEFESHGLRCRIIRNGMGSLCGYVGVTVGHKLYGVGYDDIDGADVHGGLTYAGHHEDSTDVWWIGFDCAHGGDMVPTIEMIPGTYRDIEYVRRELEVLAAFVASV